MKSLRILLVLIFLAFLLSAVYAEKLTNFPIFFSTSELGVGFGVASVYTYKPKYKHLNEKLNSFAGTGFYTTKKQFAVFLKNEHFFMPEYKYKLIVKFMDFPVNFYGIGNDTKFKNQEKVRFILNDFYPAVMKQLNSASYFGVVLNFGVYDINDHETGKTLSKFEHYTDYRDSSYLGLGFVYDYDSRDNKFYPTNGQFLDIKALFYVDDFYKQDLDYRYFNKLDFKPDWILASRFVFESMQRDVPLWLLPRVSLRGIESTRFIDKSSVNFEQEFRFPISKKFKGNVFAGAGNVASDVFSFDMEKTKLSSGFGVRYVLEEEQKVNFTFDFAFHNINDDDKEMYFYFKMLERF